MKYLVGIDEGTGGCKTCVFDENGNLISSSSREYYSYYPQPGYVEQDINEIKLNVFQSCQDAINKSGINPEDIVGVSHSNQGITMVLLDEAENPVRERTIGWQDVRHTQLLSDLKTTIDNEKHYELSGMSFGSYNIAILNWLQKEESRNWKKVNRICSHQDYFLRQLGADDYYIDEGSANFLSMLDVKTNEWSEELTKIYNINRDQLPKVVHEPGKVVGYVSESVSTETNLPVGCPVCLGGLDTNCCSLAVGAREEGTQVLIVGTAGVSIVISDKLIFDPNRRVTVRSNPGFGNWQMYIMTNTAASSFRWFRDELCGMEVATSQLMVIDPYDIITSIAKNSKPGSNGLTAMTCLQGSHGRRKNENARGTILGISLATKKSDIARAILEGICFEMYDISLLNESVGAKIDKVRLAGGVTKSPMWCQMFADILQKPVELSQATELGSLGAAMCAGIGAGLFKDCDDAIDKCVHVVKTYVPNTNNFEMYQKAFDRWNSAYNSVIELYYSKVV